MRAPMGWIVLLGGSEAGAWGAPGAIQRLVDNLPAERFQHLGLGALGPRGGSQSSWGGAPCNLYFEQGAAQLEELARILGSLLSRPGHEVTPKALPISELARRRAARSFSYCSASSAPWVPRGRPPWSP